MGLLISTIGIVTSLKLAMGQPTAPPAQPPATAPRNPSPAPNPNVPRSPGNPVPAPSPEVPRSTGILPPGPGVNPTSPPPARGISNMQPSIVETPIGGTAGIPTPGNTNQSGISGTNGLAFTGTNDGRRI